MKKSGLFFIALPPAFLLVSCQIADISRTAAPNSDAIAYEIGKITNEINTLTFLQVTMTVLCALYTFFLITVVFVFIRRNRGKASPACIKETGGVKIAPASAAASPAADTDTADSPELDYACVEALDLESMGIEDIEISVGVDVPLDVPAGQNLIHMQETSLGNLAADALVYLTGADAGFVNSGSIRLAAQAGDITKDDIPAAFPFKDPIIVQGLTGAHMKAVLEHSASMLPEADGRFMHVSGICAELDISEPVGSRIVSVVFSDGSPIDENKEYIIATSSYIGGGGDGYGFLAHLPSMIEEKSIGEAVLAFISEKASPNQRITEAPRISFLRQAVSVS